MVTALGSYATAPTRMPGSFIGPFRSSMKDIRNAPRGFPELEQRQPGQRLADQVLQVVDRGGHDPSGAGVAEEALDRQVSRERGAAAGLHREVRDVDGGLDGAEARLE